MKKPWALLLSVLLTVPQTFSADAADVSPFNSPIVVRKNAATALDYHNIPFDSHHRLSKEPLVDLAQVGIAGENFYSRSDGLNAPYYKKVCASKQLFVRRTVAGKLLQVNDLLRPYGVELFVLDAYRHISCQRELWTYFVELARKKLGPADEKAVKALAGRYCSDPSKFDPKNSATWPTHTTGGAVDLTLRRLNSGEELFMGSIFDDPSEQSHSAFYETLPVDQIGVSETEARRNRRLLNWAMSKVGFANFPYEWWHFDYGTQMWVQNGKAHEAFYGFMNTTQPHPKSYKEHPQEQ